MITKYRYKLAFMFGRWEHGISRLLFVELCLTYTAYLLHYDWLLRYLLPLAIAMWLGYWGSHRAEKWAFPRNVR
jgi:hypothetical protein